MCSPLPLRSGQPFQHRDSLQERALRMDPYGGGSLTPILGPSRVREGSKVVNSKQMAAKPPSACYRIKTLVQGMPCPLGATMGSGKADTYQPYNRGRLFR